MVCHLNQLVVVAVVAAVVMIIVINNFFSFLFSFELTRTISVYLNFN